jgi:hypothetical protein
VRLVTMYDLEYHTPDGWVRLCQPREAYAEILAVRAQFLAKHWPRLTRIVVREVRVPDVAAQPTD